MMSKMGGGGGATKGLEKRLSAAIAKREEELARKKERDALEVWLLPSCHALACLSLCGRACGRQRVICD